MDKNGKTTFLHGILKVSPFEVITLKRNSGDVDMFLDVYGYPYCGSDARNCVRASGALLSEFLNNRDKIIRHNKIVLLTTDQSLLLESLRDHIGMNWIVADEAMTLFAVSQLPSQCTSDGSGFDLKFLQSVKFPKASILKNLVEKPFGYFYIHTAIADGYVVVK